MAKNNNHFELTLDTLAPSGSITRPAQYVNDQTTLAISKDNASFMYVWFDTSSSTSSIPEGTALIPAADSYESQFTTNGVFYYHLVLVDNVNNQSNIYTTESITYDTVKPVVSNVEIVPRDYATGVEYKQGRYLEYTNKFYMAKTDISAAENTSFAAIQSKLVEKSTFDVTTTRDVAIRFKASDTAPSSGLVSCAVDGNVNADSTAWATALTQAEISALAAGNYVKRTIVLDGTGEEEVEKTVNITVTDNAGNTADKVGDTITLDTKFLIGTIVLKNAAGTSTITGTWVNTPAFEIELEASEKSDWAGYRVWGDFNAYTRYAVDTAYAANTLIVKDTTDTKVYKVTADITAAENTGWSAIESKVADSGESQTTAKPAEFTPLTAAEIAAKKVVLDRFFTSGDFGSDTAEQLAQKGKCVYGEIVDANDNVTLLQGVHAKVDYTAPTVSVAIKSGETQYVSKIDGFKTKNLVPTTDSSIAGIASFQWKMDGVDYPNGSGTTDPTEFQVSSDNMGTLTPAEEEAGKGARVFTLTVTDKAGNTTTSEGVTVYLDTVAPDGSITMSGWFGGNNVDTTAGFRKYSEAGATAAANDSGAGMQFMTCWCSTIENDTTVVGVQKAYAENPAHGDINWDGHAESATNYIHIQYVDAVGNTVILHSAAFGIDTIVPGDGKVEFTKEAYPSVSATTKLTYSDATSGVNKFKIWGDITSAASEAEATWENIASIKSVTLTTGDGEKTAYVRFRDVAGNTSVNVVSDITELDTSTPGANLTLFKTDGVTSLPTHVNSPEFNAHVAYTGDDALGKRFYQIYGDFNFDEQGSDAISYVACSLYRFNQGYSANALVLNEGVVYKVLRAVTSSENIGWVEFMAKPIDGTVVDYAVSTAYAKDAYIKNTDGIVYKANEAITEAENTSFEAIRAKLDEWVLVAEDTAAWKELVYDSGKTYKALTSLFFTSNTTPSSVAKNVYLKIMDNAGNISETATVLTYYDTKAPEVNISTQADYVIISKVGTVRKKNVGGTIVDVEDGQLANTITFGFTPTEAMQAYKVCAHATEAKAKAVTSPADETPIPTTGGSSNTSDSGLDTQIEIKPVIKGADYETALIARAEAFSAEKAYAVGDIVTYESKTYTCKSAHSAGAWSADHFREGVDGAHFIVVYVQDLGGTWSQVWSFEA